MERVFLGNWIGDIEEAFDVMNSLEKSIFRKSELVLRGNFFFFGFEVGAGVHRYVWAGGILSRSWY